MNGPVKLAKKKNAAAAQVPVQRPVKPKPKPLAPRNPLKELNSCSLPSTRSCRDVLGRGGSGPLPSRSSSSTSGSAHSGSFSRSKSLSRDPKSAPPSSRVPLRAINSANTSELRSGVLPKNPPSRSIFGSLRQVGANKPQKPRDTDHPQRRDTSKVGPNRSFLKDKKKNVAVGGDGDAAAKPTVLGGRVVSTKRLNQEHPTASVPRRKAFIPGFKISNPSTMVDDIPDKDGEEQQQQLFSLTPKSTGATTPPVQASLSPEILGDQSMMPTPTCFAAGHLLTGIQDRRKCRARGILNGGAGGIETTEKKRSLRSPSDHRDQCGFSWIPPPLVEASMYWLSPPRDGETGIGRHPGTSSLSSGIPLQDGPVEASVNWLLSPSVYDTGESGVLDLSTSPSTVTPNAVYSPNKVNSGSSADATVGVAGKLPVLKGLKCLTSPQRKDTSCIWEYCCSPSADGSVSPYSMILRKAGAWTSCEDLSLEEDGEGCCYDSVGQIPRLSQNNGCGVCSSSFLPNRLVEWTSPMVLRTMTQAAEARSSSPQARDPSCGSKDCLPLSAMSFQFSHVSTPSNSVDLACFKRTLPHQSSVQGELSVVEEKSSHSGLRVSWRKGLIGRISEMDEMDCHDRRTDRGDLGKIVAKPANGSGFFGLSGHLRTEKRCGTEVPYSSTLACAESFSMEGNGIEASTDSDWSLFYRNNLFQS